MKGAKKTRTKTIRATKTPQELNNELNKEKAEVTSDKKSPPPINVQQQVISMQKQSAGTKLWRFSLTPCYIWRYHV